MLEWKSSLEKGLSTGQRLTYERLTIGEKVTVIVIIGNAETMQCEKYCFYFNGKKSKWVDAGLEEVKEKIKAWVLWTTR